MPRILSSLIQSDFGGDHGNFEAVILEGDSLVHWWRDNNSTNFPWKRGQTILASGVSAAGSRNVPLFAGQGGTLYGSQSWQIQSASGCSPVASTNFAWPFTTQAKGSFKIMEDDVADALEADFVLPESAVKPGLKMPVVVYLCAWHGLPEHDKLQKDTE